MDGMVIMTTREPQSAADYEDRTTAAVKSVLIEIGQIPAVTKENSLLLEERYLGCFLTMTICRMSARLILIWIWIQQRWAMVNTPLWWKVCRVAGMNSEGVTRAFQLVRTIPASDDGPAIDIIIDFLRPRDAELVKNAPPLISNFAVQRRRCRSCAQIL